MTLNKVMLIGNLTRDPETRTTATGINVASFGLATNFIWTNAAGEKQEKVEFHNIVAWRKLADICSQYLTKGRQVYIEGRLQTRSWDDQSGNKHYKTEVIADNMIMLGSKPATATTSYSEEVPAPAQEEAPATEEINVEEIPF